MIKYKIAISRGRIMSSIKYDDNDKDKVLLELLTDTEFVLQILINKVLKSEVKYHAEQNCIDDERLKSLMFLFNLRKKRLIELINAGEK